MVEQAQAVRQVLPRFDSPVSAKSVAAAFKGAQGSHVAELLETLAALGQVRVDEQGRYVG